eukprot:250502-Chlamydomonas_euryale.AAC.27
MRNCFLSFYEQTGQMSNSDPSTCCKLCQNARARHGVAPMCYQCVTQHVQFPHGVMRPCTRRAVHIRCVDTPCMLLFESNCPAGSYAIVAHASASVAQVEQRVLCRDHDRRVGIRRILAVLERRIDHVLVLVRDDVVHVGRQPSKREHLARR